MSQLIEAIPRVYYRDEMRTRQQIMRSVAIGRVLERARDRSAISSPRDFRLAYLNELAMHGEEIAAETYRILALARQAKLAATRKALRCVICGGPIGGTQRPSRRYCSDRCRQRAHRRRVSPAAMEWRRSPISPRASLKRLPRVGPRRCQGS